MPTNAAWAVAGDDRPHRTTLRSGDLEQVVSTGKAIAGLVPEQGDSVKHSLMSPVAYGLVAHSRSWKGDPRKVVERLTADVHALAAKHATEPRELPELLCIGDLAGWRLGHGPGTRFILPSAIVPGTAAREGALALLQEEFESHPNHVVRSPDAVQLLVEQPHGECQVQYLPGHIDPESPTDVWVKFRPVGAFVAALYDRLAYRDEAPLDISRYFSRVHVPASSGGLSLGRGRLPWPRTVIPDKFWADGSRLGAVFF